jgi:uncharacterized protein
MREAAGPLAGRRLPPRAVLAADRWLRIGLIAVVLGYQRSLGYVMGGQCRFYPSCSNYGLDALRTKPSWRALPLIAWRIARCQPLCKGGWDEVKARPEDGTYRLLSVQKVELRRE